MEGRPALLYEEHVATRLSDKSDERPFGLTVEILNFGHERENDRLFMLMTGDFSRLDAAPAR